MPLARLIARACLLPAGLLLVLTGCADNAIFAPAPPAFNPVAYQNAVQMKVDTQALIDKSGLRYAANGSAVEALKNRYAAAEEASSKNPGDIAVTKAWQAIRGTSTGSAVEYFDTWKKRSMMKPAIRSEKKAQIGRHFDYVICLEAAKANGPACVNPIGPTPSVPPPPAPDAAEGEQ